MALDKEALRLKIEEEIVKTESLINSLKDFTQPISPENAIGRISRMDAINNRSVNEASLRQATSKLKNLEIAREQINQPSFGICIKCKQPIPEGRIMLMPQTKKCVNCA